MDRCFPQKNSTPSRSWLPLQSLNSGAVQPLRPALGGAGAAGAARWQCCPWHTPYLGRFCLVMGAKKKPVYPTTPAPCPLLHMKKVAMPLCPPVLSHLSKALAEPAPSAALPQVWGWAETRPQLRYQADGLLEGCILL